MSAEHRIDNKNPKKSTVTKCLSHGLTSEKRIVFIHFFHTHTFSLYLSCVVSHIASQSNHNKKLINHSTVDKTWLNVAGCQLSAAGWINEAKAIERERGRKNEEKNCSNYTNHWFHFYSAIPFSYFKFEHLSSLIRALAVTMWKKMSEIIMNG